jgi:hypothetical protein
MEFGFHAVGPAFQGDSGFNNLHNHFYDLSEEGRSRSLDQNCAVVITIFDSFTTIGHKQNRDCNRHAGAGKKERDDRIYMFSTIDMA